MKWSEIPLVDYIEIHEEQCDVYVHTKDKRMIVFKDVCSNGHLDEIGFYVDYMLLDRRMTGFVPREDFSHMEYRYTQRPDMDLGVDELLSKCPPVLLTEPDEHLYEDLV